MELELDVMIEIYQIFSKFDIDIPQEDYDQVDSLKLRFKNMIDHSKAVSDQIADMKDTLFVELTEGIEVLKAEIDVFNEEFETKGPMIDGLPAKVASDRVSHSSSIIIFLLDQPINDTVFGPVADVHISKSFRRSRTQSRDIRERSENIRTESQRISGFESAQKGHQFAEQIVFVVFVGSETN